MKSNKVKRWLASYPKVNTQNRYRTALSRFCAFFDVTPNQSLTWSLDKIEDNLHDWKVSMIKEKLAGATIRLYLTALTRWFKFNRKRIHVDDLTKNLSRKDSYTDYPVTRDDVRKLLDGARLKHKVAISLIAFSGMRPVDVVTLQYRDIVQSYERGDEVLTIQKIHEKTEREYVSFLGHQGTRYLRDYLERRKEKGEKVNLDSYILPYRGKQMQSQGLRIVLRGIIESTVGTNPTGNDRKKFRPYSLRKYFRHVVVKLGEDTAEYLMGHVKGLDSMSATYNGLRDGHPEAIARLKEQYISILPELETELSETTIRAEIQEQKEAQSETVEELREEIHSMKKVIDELLRTAVFSGAIDQESGWPSTEKYDSKIEEIIQEKEQMMKEIREIAPDAEFIKPAIDLGNGKKKKPTKKKRAPRKKKK